MSPLVIIVVELVLLWVAAGIMASRITSDNPVPGAPSGLAALLQGGKGMFEALVYSTKTVLSSPPTMSTSPSPPFTPSPKIAPPPFVSAPPALDSPSFVSTPASDTPPSFVATPVTPPPFAEPPAFTVNKPNEFTPPAFVPPAPDALAFAIVEDFAPGVVKPAKIPKRPMIGAAKVLNPYTNSVTKHGRDGVCKETGKLNPWLAEKWKLDTTEKPTKGKKVKAQKPDKNKTTKEKKGISFGKKRPVDLIPMPDMPMPDPQSMAAPVDATWTPAPADMSAITPVPAPQWSEKPVGMGLSTLIQCPSCQRRSAADLYGNCIFCKTSLLLVQS